MKPDAEFTELTDDQKQAALLQLRGIAHFILIYRLRQAQQLCQRDALPIPQPLGYSVN